jgi:hypothetical protein
VALARFRLLLTALLLAVACSASALSMPRFDTLEVKLKIRPEQKQQFDAAAGATQRAILAVGLTVLQLKDKLGEELLKPRPDFRSFVETQEALIEQTKPLFREAREEWAKLYALLDDEQLAIAKSFVDEHIGRFFKQLQ